jgi:2-polyprenyl-3-methyl-5-hydroxy-6-metoxy-1,4-benzoquinol methylase
LEPDPIAAESLRKCGVKVTQGTLPNEQLQEASFDVITASHVIEHVSDPSTFLSACFRLLRLGGHLIVATPNANSAGLKRYGQSWVHLDAPRHLVLFTPESVADSLRAAHFQIESVTTSSRSAFFVTKTSRGLERGTMRIALNAKFSLVDKCAALATFLREGLFLHSQLGQEIVAIARKGNS